MSNLPIIAISMGDAAGIGPEIIVKALTRSEPRQFCRPVVVGDANRLAEAGRLLGLACAPIRVGDIATAAWDAETILCLDLPLIPPGTPFGQLSAVCGDAAFRFLERSIVLARQGEVAAICTAPLNKEAMNLAGHAYPGHTEILAALTNTREVSLMLVGPRLRVIHVTGHVALLEAVALLNPGLIERTIARGREILLTDSEPVIGVCGLNPHAGENGLFSRGEEPNLIVPAIAACRAKGWQVSGPWPADALFYRAARGEFDLVVAMYHDQGHAPFKVLGIAEGVNVTAGLPIIRTSVDHGTAFDLAGKGLADERSLIAALRVAADLIARHEKSTENVI